MALKYGIPPGNPTVVWDDVEGVPGTVTNDPYVSWQYHLNRTGGARGGVDMTAANGTPVYAPIDCRVEHYSGGAGIAVRMWAADGSGWSDVFDHLSSIAVPDGANIPYGGLVGHSGGTYGYAPHLHWHRLDPSGIRRIPWDYFTNGTTNPLEGNPMEAVVVAPNGTCVHLAVGVKRNFIHNEDYNVYRDTIAFLRNAGVTNLMALPARANVPNVDWPTFGRLCEYFGVSASA